MNESQKGTIGMEDLKTVEYPNVPNYCTYMVFDYGCQIFRFEGYMKNRHLPNLTEFMNVSWFKKIRGLNIVYRVFNWLKNPNIWANIVRLPKFINFFNWSSTDTSDKPANTDTANTTPENTDEAPTGNIPEKQDVSETTDKTAKDSSKIEVLSKFCSSNFLPFKVSDKVG